MTIPASTFVVPIIHCIFFPALLVLTKLLFASNPLVILLAACRNIIIIVIMTLTVVVGASGSGKTTFLNDGKC
jgi:hypothetical protein